MNTMNIGAVIKTLRREREITQERLAEYLNVTPQAVSRWECGLALPDIAAVPVIAAFFGVSCDRLLGTEPDDRQARIDAVLREHQRLSSLGKKRERTDLLRQAVRGFPGEYRLLLKYAWDLSASPFDDFGETELTAKELRAVQEQVVGLCQRILDDCTDDRLRAGALDLMSMEYMEFDEEKAQAAAERLPDFSETRNMTLYRLWEYDTEEHRAFFQENIAELADLLWLNIRTAVWGTEDPAEKVVLCEKADAVYRALYENGDFGYGFAMLAQIHETKAEAYAALGEGEETVKALREALGDEERFAEQPDGCGTSLLSDHRRFSRGELTRDSERSSFAYFLDRLKHARYDFLRDHPDFREILRKAEAACAME
ncbi:MAG: helix-turn-helix domain-containing protein [Clostridiales bacterium]|nr:helix-turn-helix domain-containing protein [Clostridiales bacterium]